MAEDISTTILDACGDMSGQERAAFINLMNALWNAINSNATLIDTIAAEIDADSGTVGADYVTTHIADAVTAGAGTAVQAVAAFVTQ